jgi:hypothetical protein
MWALENRTPFAADRTWVRDADGAEVWVVAVKATYDILPDGSLRVSPGQPPVNTGPGKHPGLESLQHETDLGPSKAATDIILNGHAFAQSERPVFELTVGFRVGTLLRSARVHGDRFWQPGLLFSAASQAVPFLSMPLVYERAFGGDSPDSKRNSGNPVGRGIVPAKDGRTWLPNIETPDNPVRDAGDSPPVTGFGAIPVHWPGRRRYAGTYDREWLENRRPLAPRDLDPRFWQIAPPEQQVTGRLRGGEEVVLVNLTRPGYAQDGRLAFHLPRISLAFETRFLDGTRERSRPAIHTLILEPDFPRVSVVQHMTLSCHAKVNLLDRTTITQKQRPLDRIARVA